jgi:Lrp/AsnC family transcriptional regulator, leucine-responsive regulatory protein
VSREPKLDVIDRRIMQALQRDGRLANVQLAKQVHLSPTACFERVRRLEEAGYIQRYLAQLNAQKLGFNLLAFVEVSLDKTNPTAFDNFRDAVTAMPEIQECHMVAGGFDYLLKVRVEHMASYRRFLGERVSALPSVNRTHTYFVMEEVKSTLELAVGARKGK